MKAKQFRFYNNPKLCDESQLLLCCYIMKAKMKLGVLLFFVTVLFTCFDPSDGKATGTWCSWWTGIICKTCDGWGVCTQRPDGGCYWEPSKGYCYYSDIKEDDLLGGTTATMKGFSISSVKIRSNDGSTKTCPWWTGKIYKTCDRGSCTTQPVGGCYFKQEGEQYCEYQKVENNSTRKGFRLAPKFCRKVSSGEFKYKCWSFRLEKVRGKCYRQQHKCWKRTNTGIPTQNVAQITQHRQPRNRNFCRRRRSQFKRNCATFRNPVLREACFQEQQKCVKRRRDIRYLARVNVVRGASMNEPREVNTYDDL